MWYVGIDLSWRSAAVAAVDEESRRVRPRSFKCGGPEKIVEFLSAHRPFRAVIEATGTYRWLYDLLTPHGEVMLAHPLRLKAIWSGRAKTDEIDARVLAELLRAGLIPESYVPP
jgi:transposase